MQAKLKTTLEKRPLSSRCRLLRKKVLLLEKVRGDHRGRARFRRRNGSRSAEQRR